MDKLEKGFLDYQRMVNKSKRNKKKETPDNYYVSGKFLSKDGSVQNVTILKPNERRLKDEYFENRRLKRRKLQQNRKRRFAIFKRRTIAVAALAIVAITGNKMVNHKIAEIKSNAKQEVYAMEKTNKDDGASYLELVNNNQSFDDTELTPSEKKYGALTNETKKLAFNIKPVVELTPSSDNPIKEIKTLGMAYATNGEKNSIKVNESFENFLNLNMRAKSHLTAKQINKALKGTGLEGLGEAYANAEKRYNVNALFLMGLSCLESDFGNSNFAKTRNNVTGFMAYTETPSKAKVFDSKEDCIYKTASYLDKEYLDVNGKYHNGFSMLALNKKYCTSSMWAFKINNIMLDLYNKCI